MIASAVVLPAEPTPLSGTTRPHDRQASIESSTRFSANQDAQAAVFWGTVEIHRPKGGSLEEVAGFGFKTADTGKSTESSHLDVAADRLAMVPFDQLNPGAGPLYTAIRVVTISPRVWLKLRRTRTVVTCSSIMLSC